MIQADKFGNTVLHFAANSDRASLIDDLMDRDGLDRQNALGQTPLHIAHMNGKVEHVARLIAHGARQDVLDVAGKVPSDYAD